MNTPLSISDTVCSCDESFSDHVKRRIKSIAMARWYTRGSGKSRRGRRPNRSGLGILRNGRAENQAPKRVECVAVGAVVADGGGDVDGLKCDECDEERTCDPVVVRASAAVDDPPESGGVDGDTGTIVKDDLLRRCDLDAGIGDR